MSALSIPSGNSNPMVQLIEELQLHLEESVHHELLTNAVVLRCGHSYNENTVADLKASSSQATCPECEKPITDYTISYTLRSIAEKVKSLPSLVETQPITSTSSTITNNREIKETKEYYELHRALCKQGIQEKAVSAILKAVELYPDYDKALIYLDFVTAEVRRCSLNPDLADAVRPRITTFTRTTTSDLNVDVQVNDNPGELWIEPVIQEDNNPAPAPNQGDNGQVNGNQGQAPVRLVVAGDNNPAPVPNEDGDGQVNDGQGQAPVGLVVAGGNNPAPVLNEGDDGQVNDGQGQVPVGLVVVGGNNPVPVLGRVAQIWNVLYPAGAAVVRNTPAVACAISKVILITFKATYPVVLAIAEATPGVVAKGYEIAAPVCVVMKDYTVVAIKALWKGSKSLYAIANALLAIDQTPVGRMPIRHAVEPILLPMPLPTYAENVNKATHQILDCVLKLVSN